MTDYNSQASYIKSYDVTTFASPSNISPYEDIGKIISEIQDDIILQQQTNQDDKGLRPGTTIFIPAGRYRLQTTFVITIHYLVIQGAGHGWMSQASRDAPDTDSSGWLETAPGASFIELDTSSTLTAIKIERDDFATTGRISGVELRDFCIGLVVATNPYNTSGTKGIDIASDSDSLRIEGMGFSLLEEAMVVRNADSISITNNFIGECANCITMTSSSIVAKITNNFFGNSPGGYSISIENGDRHQITGNTFFWNPQIVLLNTHHTNISANKFQGSWPGTIVMLSPCDENLVSSNMFIRVDTETASADVGDTIYDDLMGIVHISGNNNSITSNMFSITFSDVSNIRPAGADPVAILVTDDSDNTLLSSNHLAYSDNISVKIVLDSSSRNSRVFQTALYEEFLPSAGATYIFLGSDGKDMNGNVIIPAQTA